MLCGKETIDKLLFSPPPFADFDYNNIYAISCFQVFEVSKYRESLSTYWQVDSHENISSISEIILGETKAYVFFDRHYGDLHSYVRQKKRLKEEEACHLFQQIVAAVQHCHDNGVILRDLKLRKFVFKNKERYGIIVFCLGLISALQTGKCHS